MPFLRSLLHRGAVTLSVMALVGLAGCSTARYPAPTERLESAEEAAREASALGADQDPVAHFHLALAQHQIRIGKELMASGKNGRAAWVLTRAATDALLAVELVRENVTRAEAQEAAQQVEALQRGSP